MAIPDLTEKGFAKLSKREAVRRVLRPAKPFGLQGLGCYLVGLPVWLLFAAFGAYALDRAGLYPGRWLLYLFLTLAVILPMLPLLRPRRDFRQPLLEALAAEFKLDYDSHDFTPPGWAQAQPLLFGESEDATFTDRLAGIEDKRAFMTGQAALQAKGGKKLFEGAIYAIDRGEGMSGTTVAAPAGSKAPRGDMELVSFEDPAFEAAFTVYSTRPDFALKQIDTELRSALTGLAESGPFNLYYDTEQVFAAGGPPFETGETAAQPSEQRFRALYDNVATAFRTLAILNAKLG